MFIFFKSYKVYSNNDWHTITTSQRKTLPRRACLTIDASKVQPLHSLLLSITPQIDNLISSNSGTSEIMAFFLRTVKTACLPSCLLSTYLPLNSVYEPPDIWETAAVIVKNISSMLRRWKHSRSFLIQTQMSSSVWSACGRAKITFITGTLRELLSLVRVSVKSVARVIFIGSEKGTCWGSHPSSLGCSNGFCGFQLRWDWF